LVSVAVSVCVCPSPTLAELTGDVVSAISSMVNVSVAVATVTTVPRIFTPTSTSIAAVQLEEIELGGV
jgi:hypothetical protein